MDSLYPQEQVSVMICVIKFFKGRGFWGPLSFYFLLCLLLYGCITKFEPKGTDETEGILVVEGFITDDESVITLSRSKGLSYKNDPEDMISPYRVTGANVSIECDDGTQWVASGQNLGEYTVETGKLNPERQYRLKIEVDGHEYQSEFACPMVSPEIDSVFWMKNKSGQPVNIYVATYAPDSMVQYYRWSYREVWEYVSYLQMGDGYNPFYPDGFPFFCWGKANNSGLLLGSSEKTVSGKIIHQLTEILPWDDKLSILYRIDVKQNVIRKRAYDYFENVKKNAQQAGSLFAHVPSELKGNITCITDPKRTVIGYVDVSSTTQKRLYISPHDYIDVYERPKVDNCNVVSRYEFFYAHNIQLYGGRIPEYFLVWDWDISELTGDTIPSKYVFNKCVDCTLWDGTTQKPADWPNDHSDAHTVQE